MHARQPSPISYLITAGDVNASNFRETSRRMLDIVRVAVAEGVDMIQVREKTVCGRLLCELVSSAVDIARGSATKLLVNDRADIALACGANGVHLTRASIPVSSVRWAFPANFVIGVSTHTVDDVRKASLDGAEFAVFGPVFATPGKGEPVGVRLLADACRAGGEFPVLGLGGVDEFNFRAVIDAGAAGFAAIRAMNSKDQLRSMMRFVKTV